MSYYDKSLTSHFSNSFYSDNWVSEIQNSAITIALDYVEVNGDQIRTYFKDTLDQDNIDIFNALPAVHDATPPAAAVIEVKPHYGDDSTVIDGISVQFTASQWARVEYDFVEDLSIQSVHVTYTNLQHGDYGRLSISHPVNENGYFSPTSVVSINDTTLSVDATAAATAAAAGIALEFWNNDDTELLEIRGIAGVNGTTITLAEAVTHNHSTSARIRLIVGCFSPIGGGGTDHIESGFRAVGNGNVRFGSENEATAPITAGLQLAHRFKASSAVATREIAVSYRFRRIGG